MIQSKLSTRKVLLVIVLILCGYTQSMSQSVGINTDGYLPNSRSILDIKSSTKGVLLPRVSSTERSNISLGASEKDMMVFDTDINRYCYWNGSSWMVIGLGRMIEDADGDTRITVELTPGASPDDDVIMFQSQGAERMRLAANGRLGLNTPSPLALFDMNTGSQDDAGFLVRGELDAANGTLPDLGRGSRMMYFPAKAAFRAGSVYGTQWDNANIGRNSVALGANTIASGEYSFAMGDGSESSAYNSVAMGYLTRASGSTAVAMGIYSNASGNNSTAIGNAPTASGIGSTALGFGAAYGDFSTAIGGGQAIGDYSMALGANTANSYGETALGIFNAARAGNATTWVADDNLFSIGNGSDFSNRSNVLEIRKNGLSMLNGRLSISSTGSVPNTYSILDISASDQGVLLPRMTTAERNAITGLNTTEVGLTVFDTDLNQYNYWNGTTWVAIGTEGTMTDADGDTRVELEIGSTDNDDIRFHTFGTERMVIGKDGNVGIGTTSPSELFEVAGLVVNKTPQNLVGAVYIHTPDAYGYQSFYASNTGNVNSVEVWLCCSEASTQVRIYEGAGTTGSLLFSTTTSLSSGYNNIPVSGVNLVGGNTYTLYLGNARYWYFNSADVYAGGERYYGTSWVTSVGDFRFRIDQDPSFEEGLRFSVHSLGVNIGEYTLPYIDGEAGNMLVSDGSGNISWTSRIASMNLEDSDSDTRIEVERGTSDDDQIRISTAGSERMRINNNGDIGIGTITPFARLHVAGNSRFDGIINTRGQWVSGDGSEEGLYIAVDGQVNINRTFDTNNQWISGDGESEGLYIADNGNVGVGTNTPSYPLDVLTRGRLGNAVIGEFDPIIGHAFFGHTNLDHSVNTNYALLQSPTGYTHLNTPTVMYIKHADRIKMRVTGNQVAFYSGTNINTGGNWISGDGSPEGLYISGNGQVNINRTFNTNNQWISGDGGPEGLYVADNGNVGIGTKNPYHAKLHVNGYQLHNINSFSVVNNYNNQVQHIGGTYSRSISIYATDRIVGLNVISMSDERIKEIKGISNSQKDLEILKKIQITDYQYKDKVTKGDGKQKKVIAQQLDKVFPQAVDKDNIEVVPDIYQMASIKDGWVTLANTLKVGEKVELVFDSGKELFDVLEVEAERFKVESAATGEVFVYGRQVNDFHTVDYDAVSMLNVSATQELIKQVEQLKAENASLKAKVASLEELKAKVEEMESLKARLEKIEALLAPKAEKKSTDANQTK